MSRPLICDVCGTMISEHPTQFTQYAEVKRHGAMAVDLHADVKYDLCIGCFKRIFEKGSDPDENEEDCDVGLSEKGNDPDENEEDCDGGLSELIEKLFHISKGVDEGSDSDETE